MQSFSSLCHFFGTGIRTRSPRLGDLAINSGKCDIANGGRGIFIVDGKGGSIGFEKLEHGFQEGCIGCTGRHSSPTVLCFSSQRVRDG